VGIGKSMQVRKNALQISQQVPHFFLIEYGEFEPSNNNNNNNIINLRIANEALAFFSDPFGTPRKMIGS